MRRVVGGKVWLLVCPRTVMILTEILCLQHSVGVYSSKTLLNTAGKVPVLGKLLNDRLVRGVEKRQVVE